MPRIVYRAPATVCKKKAFQALGLQEQQLKESFKADLSSKPHFFLCRKLFYT